MSNAGEAGKFTSPQTKGGPHPVPTLENPPRVREFPRPLNPTEPKSAPIDAIQIRGARQNNLKGFDLDIPLGKLNVVSGPSGSGKSSLAFDTIYAEGQRRYVETFSPYTRQFMERMDKPKVDAIHGIPPAIAIEQSNHVKSTRSTVGTITEINDYLKILMPRLAKAFCPDCGREIRVETVRSIAAQVFESVKPSRKKNAEPPAVLITFGVPVPAKTKPAEFFEFLCAQGYLRVWIEGAARRTDEAPGVTRLPAIVRVIQDRVTLAPENHARLSEAIEAALRLGRGQLAVIPAEGRRKETGYADILPFSTGWHCAHCDIEIAPPTSGLFSFNNPIGACPKCRGFGRSIGIDLDRAIPDRSISIANGAVKPFQTENGAQCQHDLLRACRERDIDTRIPFEELPPADQDFVIFGEKRTGKVSVEDLAEEDRWYGVKGFFDWLESKSYKMHVRVLLSRYRTYTLCTDCRGGRYQPSTLNFRLAGHTLPQLAAMPADKLAHVIAGLKESIAKDDPNTEMIRQEIETRLRYLAEVGLGYLTLDRATKTLSGGEVERVNLTTCLGASLVNALFVMDEPSVGLHQRDIGRLIRVMKNLRDKGNTLLVVEHEESVIRAADNLIELGPGRGEAGGGLVFNGPVAKVSGVPESLTGDYLAGRKSIPVPKQRRAPKYWLDVKGAAEHNLRKIDVRFPLGVFTCVTGVSGSGKSTLVNDVLFENFQAQRGLSSDESAVGRCSKLVGTQRIENMVLVDQSPLSRTPRSSPAVYLGAFDPIRELFALEPAAAEAGLAAGAFSFNSGKGRCDRCAGNGFEKIEMQFLSDVFIRCPECDGKRYQPHLLKIKLKGKSIHDVLEFTVSEAIEFFTNLRAEALKDREAGGARARLAQKVIDPLRILEEVGLGYLRLGQPLNVLSGGESQRLKLVGHLTNQDSGESMLILDEPTTGLHFDDIAVLVKVFGRLVEQGNSLVVIEHNLDVIKCADYVIDLGPDAGDAGGGVVAAGTPEHVATVAASHTGRYLKPVLQRAQSKAASVVYTEEPEEAELAAEAPVPYALRSSGIDVRGAREHNLKNISLTIPRDQMVVVTGLSGSGKSTLAFDILFAEGQRRFLDSMSPYARQFVEQLEKPEVDLISGLPPTVAIEQRVTRGGGKSTVATVTEVYHFLRLLFAKLGTQWCPKCKAPVEGRSAGSIVAQAEALARTGRLKVLATLVKARKGFHTEIAQWALRHGYETLLVDGEFVPAAGFQRLERFREHTIDVLLGEVSGEAEVRALVERALEIGKGTARLLDAKGRSTILSTQMNCPTCGDAFEELDPRLFSFNSPHGWCTVCRGFGEVWDAAETPERESALEAELDEERQHEWLDEGEAVVCPSCKGSRLNAIARNVRLQNFTIDEITSKSVRKAQELFGKLRFEQTDAIIAGDILPEIGQRLEFMGKVGLDYLALNRSAKTLSGGESQRIRLSAQLGSNLRGVLYVLDEPTIGLHPRDNQALLDTLDTLKAKGNSLVVVEHDEDTMRRADTIVDLGPRAGSHGGEVVCIGPMSAILKNPRSATGRCLREPLRHPTLGERRSLKTVSNWIEITGACVNNLKDVDVRIPVGRFSVLTGISGSGKSTLMRSVLLPAVKNALSRRKAAKTHGYEEIKGTEHLANVYEVDQSPIGKTSRSTPATYIGFFDEIRKQFAQIPIARMRGYTASRFSFNNEGGRCETCGGQGVIKVEMNFLPASYIPCGDCHGKRYNAPTLEVLFNGKSIGDVLDLTFEEAAEFFRANPRIHRPLALLVETGLGYLKLGQPSPTLSGGEAQRLKLVTELTRGLGVAETTRLRRQRVPKSTLYLLEEPTIGLHMADVHELLKVLHRLVDDGNTVVVIEHNISLVADADYVVDIGPEAGDAGGRIVAAGSPEQVAKSTTSHTAPFLRDALKGAPPGTAPEPSGDVLTAA
jgi:excinuclease ABC subunit A